jgi:hypothetical protein
VDQKEETIRQIVAIEWEMFHSVKASEPTVCQQSPGTFRLMRWMSHSVLPEAVLESYLRDLNEAVEQNRNPMTDWINHVHRNRQTAAQEGFTLPRHPRQGEGQ